MYCSRFFAKQQSACLADSIEMSAQYQYRALLPPVSKISTLTDLERISTSSTFAGDRPISLYVHCKAPPQNPLRFLHNHRAVIGGKFAVNDLVLTLTERNQALAALALSLYDDRQSISFFNTFSCNINLNGWAWLFKIGCNSYAVLQGDSQCRSKKNPGSEQIGTTIEQVKTLFSQEGENRATLEKKRCPN